MHGVINFQKVGAPRVYGLQYFWALNRYPARPDTTPSCVILAVERMRQKRVIYHPARTTYSGRMKARAYGCHEAARRPGVKEG